MKKLFFAGAISALSSCATATDQKNATVIRDCTGTYLRIESKDFLVCNEAVLKPFATNSKVSAAYNKIAECKEFEGKMTCMMYHEHEGIIRITSVK